MLNLFYLVKNMNVTKVVVFIFYFQWYSNSCDIYYCRVTFMAESFACCTCVGCYFLLLNIRVCSVFYSYIERTPNVCLWSVMWIYRIIYIFNTLNIYTYIFISIIYFTFERFKLNLNNCKYLKLIKKIVLRVNRLD